MSCFQCHYFPDRFDFTGTRRIFFPIIFRVLVTLVVSNVLNKVNLKNGGEDSGCGSLYAFRRLYVVLHLYDLCTTLSTKRRNRFIQILKFYISIFLKKPFYAE